MPMHGEATVGADERRHLVAIVVAAVGLRVAAALYIGSAVGEHLPGLADQLSYHTLAQRVLEGHGFSFAVGWWPATPAGEPTAHWSYLYTLILSGIYAVVGVSPLVVRLLQAIAVGVLHPYLSWRVGRRLFGPRVAMACALLAAGYGYFVYYSAALMTEALYMVAVLWVMDLALRLGVSEPAERQGGWATWGWLGVATAAAVLFRQVFLLCVPIVVLWVAYRHAAAARARGLAARPALQTAATGAALTALVLALCVVPATIRNYRAFGRFVPVNTNAGFALFWGNHPAHGDTFKPLLPGDGSHYGRLIPDDLRHLDEAALDQALLAQGIRFAVDDPVRYVRLTLGRVREYVKFWPSADSGLTSNLVRVASFGVLLPLMLVGLGLAATGRTPATAGDRHAGTLLVAVALAYAAIHVLVWTLVRYRLPVDALMVPYAGLGLTWMADRVGAAEWLPRRWSVSYDVR
jgi:hypothetical protein